MWRLKACKNCGGDLFQEDDWPREWVCLQCSRRVYDDGARPVPKSRPGQRAAVPKDWRALQEAVDGLG